MINEQRREYMREYQKNWVRDRRRSWIDSQGGMCVKCGSQNCLEVDHIDPNTKLLTPAKLWSLSETNEKRIKELAKCQVLCYNCHLAKTVAERIPPLIHGTTTGYDTYQCKCVPCRGANAQRQREKRARYKRAKELEEQEHGLVA